MGKKSPPPKPPDLQPITDAQIQIARSPERRLIRSESLDYFDGEE